MFYTKDHKSIDMFDQFAFLGEKRRRLLDNSWAKIFREEILHNLPADKLTGVYHEFFGRPTKEIYAMLRVVRLDSGRYEVSVKYLDLKSDEKDKIITYLFKKQRESIRSGKG